MSNLTLRLVSTRKERDIARRLVEKYHSYVPNYKSVGRRIDWLIFDNIQIVGMIGIGSSTYPPSKSMLVYFGMSKEEYKSIFNNICNNWRFCLKPGLQKNTGTKVLKLMRTEAKVEWEKKYGNKLNYMITFVGGGNTGTVYKADNWKFVGETAGLPKHKSSSMKLHSSKELKDLFVKPTGEDKKLIFIKKL